MTIVTYNTVLIALVSISIIPFIIGDVNVYVADLFPLNGTSVTGEAIIFVDIDNGMIGYGGYSMNVSTTGLKASTCNEYPNACGAHIHNGTSCETTTTQGGHLYNMSTVLIDPWINERYSSNDNGYATFSNTIQMGTNDVLGKPFIIHSENGTRIACGILKEGISNNVLKTDLDPFDSSEIEGEVTAYRLKSSSVSSKQSIDIDFPLTDLLYFYVIGELLTPNIVSYLNENSTSNDCNVTNGCGVHLHFGSSCNSIELQMGHYYNNNTFGTDPWTLINYDRTNEIGDTYVTHCVPTGETNYTGKAFILHEKDGKRVACGILAEPDSSSSSGGDVVPSSTTPKASSASCLSLLLMSNVVIMTTTTLFIGLLGMFW